MLRPRTDAGNESATRGNAATASATTAHAPGGEPYLDRNEFPDDAD